MYFRNISIRWQLLVICTLLVSVPVIISGILSYTTSKNEIYASVEEKLREQTVMLASHIRITMQTIQEKVNSDLKVARFLLDSSGPPSLNTEDQISMEASNQMTKKTTSITIPSMTIQDKPIALNYEIVDTIQQLVGGTATIFQVIPEGLLRISTNVLTLEGSRAVGTFIPTTSPVYQTVMKGKTFYGRAYVVNAWYQTAYEPINNEQGDIIGVLYVGVKDASEPILGSFAEMVVGKTGYIWILNRQGEYVLSFKRQRDGENIIHMQDLTGRAFIKEWTTLAPTLAEGETNVDYYSWRNEDELAPRMKIAAYTYVKDWEWIIGSSTYIDDFTDSLTQLLWITLGASFCAILLGAGIIYWFTAVMVKRFGALARRMDSVASGDLMVSLSSNMDANEIGQMWRAFSKMTTNLRNLVSNVILTVKEVDNSADTLAQELTTLTRNMKQQAGSVESATESVTKINHFMHVIKDDTNELLAATEEVLASVHEMGAAIKEVSSNTGELASDLHHISTAIVHANQSVQHISGSAEQLVISAHETESEIYLIDQSFKNVSENADRSQQLAEETRNAALQGQKSVDASIQGMTELKEVVSDSAQIIQEVNSWSKQVSSILGIVDEIAEQTSLLSLNASIISAQAGEHGKGFAVVADEIKDLAIRTKDSTKEIGLLVRTLQEKTADGVKSIGEEITKADKGVELVSAVKVSLNTILESATRSSTMAADTAGVIQQTAESSQTIKSSISTMTDMVTTITKAIQEEKQDISNISTAVEHIRMMSEHVNNANMEQHKSSEQIRESMELITQNLSDIAEQTEQLQLSSGQIVEAMQTIDAIAETMLQETTTISESTVTTLENRSDVLQKLVNIFKTS